MRVPFFLCVKIVLRLCFLLERSINTSILQYIIVSCVVTNPFWDLLLRFCGRALFFGFVAFCVCVCVCFV